MDTLLKGDEVAKILRISRSQAFTLMKRGEIPSIRFGKIVRVRIDDLQKFIDDNRLSSEEIEIKTKTSASTG
ncbi:MAG: helix-turn-helix domain-containing protein, partial [Bacillota bacterium]